MFTFIIRFFDKLEDKVRSTLSHRSFIYAFIGGAAHVIFWRGIWHTSDMIQSGNWKLGELYMSDNGFWSWLFYEPITLIWTSIILLITGLFVATFIGERIIISGLRKEKKVTDQTEGEIQAEEVKINRLEEKIDRLTQEFTIIKNELVQK